MSGENHELVVRVRAAQAVLDAYRDKPFEWGKFDCVRLAALDLKLLGYKAGLARFGYYRSERSALKALRKQGFEDLTAAVDALGLPRIAPASALPGDLVGLPGPSGWIALAVVLSNGRMLAFAEQTGRCEIGEPTYAPDWPDPIAWRVAPCLK